MSEAVHTCAPEADLFGAGAAAELTRPAATKLQLDGVLVRAAEVRTKTVGADGHPLPVLCMDIRPLTGAKHTVHAEQIYSEAHRSLAEQKAATLKKGARITLVTSLADMRTILPHVQSVVLHPQP